MNLLITICARGGSKGIPGKNARLLNGVPLIGYTIRQAQQFARRVGADIALSTDGEDIRRAAAEYGLTSEYRRPPELATDEVGKIAAMRHVLEHEEQRRGKRYEFMLDLDVTSPMRTQDDLDAGLKVLMSDPAAVNLFSVNHARRNPYFSVVEKGDDGYYRLSKKSPKPVLSRQTAPVVYELNGSFYFFRREFFDKDWTTAYADKSLVYLIPHPCFDLDEPIDFEFLEFLVKERRLGFEI